MLTILPHLFGCVSVTSCLVAAAMLLEHILWTLAAGNDEGLVLFAPFTTATGACFVGGELARYRCTIHDDPNGAVIVTPKPEPPHTNYVFNRTYVTYSKAPTLTNKDVQHRLPKTNAFTYIAWASGRSVQLLSSIGGPNNATNIDISIDLSGALMVSLVSSTLSTSNCSTTHSAVKLLPAAGSLLKIVVVYYGTHVVSRVNESSSSWVSQCRHSTSTALLDGGYVSELSIGKPILVNGTEEGAGYTTTPQLSLFCVQLRRGALKEEEIEAGFRRCEKWRPRDNRTSVFADYETRLGYVPPSDDTSSESDEDKAGRITTAVIGMMEAVIALIEFYVGCRSRNRS